MYEIIVSKGEAASLMLAMSQSRQNVKKAFKKTRKTDLQTYDSIKSHLEANTDDLDSLNDITPTRLLMNRDELILTSDFIEWYVKGAKEVIKEAFNKVDEKSQEQFDNMNKIKDKVGELLAK